jgi:hypothetical protein
MNNFALRWCDFRWRKNQSIKCCMHDRLSVVVDDDHHVQCELPKKYQTMIN